ncbi:LysM peptidoglycan-binding domain-containing protein [Ramlibacter sp. PS4R-6]|uniref:LysM peptidoglycan-binding domain-containing protein n=1 Tax=Ramlibacter sp. PS4R-6 TaxID=3133438 RepID=UPI0030A89656
MQHRTPLKPVQRPRLPAVALACAGLAALLAAGAATAQSRFPITTDQRSTAQAVATSGVPLSELAPDAPDQYTVKRGDTLWAISGIFLKSPWRWPELWGMNMEEVKNPHLIYPGQQLILEKLDGRARLRVRGGDAGADPALETVKVSPRVRINPLADTSAVPTLQPNLIEPFLAEPLVVGDAELLAAPRIVAVPEMRVLITRGDRAYARGLSTTPMVMKVAGRSEDWRVFRNARAIKHPETKQVLGFEAQYVGKAQLVRSEGSQPEASSPFWSQWTGGNTVIPATIDIVSAKEEMRVGDRLLPEPPRQFTSYVPHAPAGPMGGTIVSVYGDAVSLAGQNQVVMIDKGTADGVDTGTVLAILKTGERRVDRTQSGQVANMKLPDERNGLLMVFRPFEKLSYALILEINDTVQIGDRVASPR